ncbi:GntR family transcriptional regulator [Paracoccus saliphilus]|uniref:GntR family transcriptional regulator n=1 Tax=Paracoccus saliphilus TaxID=405559 RepID=A0AA46A6C4_9RHOB|nr:GntR family transcriptional regulator [Paracoccus saliphilus]WCR05583.1 GntR family transcriptional regulator [Paracoccus saliphilus]SIS95886.1 GntR family transcriptional regulator [Paracoccus saliphilus]
MTDQIRFEPDQPLHVQVREMIRRQALNGELVDESGRLMTEAQLGRHFGVSRITIRSAIAPLVDSGLFERTPGRGTFLRSNESERWMGRLLGFQEVIAEQGYHPGAEILDKGMTNAAGEDIHAALNERAIWQLRRVRFADQMPIAIEHAFYPPDIGLDLQDRDLINIRMYQVFDDELGLRIGTARQSISARLSTGEEQRLLQLDGLTALIEMQRLTLSTDGRPLELLRAVYRSDYFRFAIDLTRA